VARIPWRVSYIWFKVAIVSQRLLDGQGSLEPDFLKIARINTCLCEPGRSKQAANLCSHLES